MPEQFNDLFENTEVREPYIEPDEFDKEAYAEYKQQERQELFDTAEAKLQEVTSDPAALNKYLSMQGRLGYSTLTTTLLIMARKPNATHIRDFEGWRQAGRSPRSNTGIKVFEANGEYRREDGTMAASYAVRRVFDVSDTYGKRLSQRQQPHMRALLKALTTDTSVPVKLSDTVEAHEGAVYSPDDNMIYVARNTDGQSLFRCIAWELSKVNPQFDDKSFDDFAAVCSAQILCARYGVPMTGFSGIPKEIQELSAEDKRGLMTAARQTACDTMERVDGNLMAERMKQRTEQDRGAR
jgi:hypothetical protein